MNLEMSRHSLIMDFAAPEREVTKVATAILTSTGRVIRCCPSLVAVQSGVLSEINLVLEQ